ncbi:chorismate mutase [Bifidobacterium amazonense]|uniref:Chorismate mutase n=1 Tax=Bifidobacterium amazonense TaxID=2809027 RepID=A0ABS9VWY2_9BIFI|nr:chorismate mutase [Bifidobacterium amazonense]MCH9276616.1 chorismate mutase [Bifidobacterium amazonense]
MTDEPAEIRACESLEEVRANIDRIDARLVALIAERGAYVAQAAQFKNSADDVKAPQRVEAVIAKVRGLAEQSHADPELVEAVWRTMIAHFTAAEMKDFAR